MGLGKTIEPVRSFVNAGANGNGASSQLSRIFVQAVEQCTSGEISFCEMKRARKANLFEQAGADSAKRLSISHQMGEELYLMQTVISYFSGRVDCGQTMENLHIQPA